MWGGLGPWLSSVVRRKGKGLELQQDRLLRGKEGLQGKSEPNRQPGDVLEPSPGISKTGWLKLPLLEAPGN